MKNLKIELSNCFGISKMSHTIDFSKENIAIIYARNGTMKSSLANTFNSIKKGEKPKDILDVSKKSKCNITDETGKSINPDNIIVVNPFKETSADNQNLLMANSTLKERYNDIYLNIETKKKALYLKLNLVLSLKSKKDNYIEDYILKLWNYSNKHDLFKCFQDIYRDLKNKDNYCELGNEDLKKYKLLFNDKVYNFFKKDEEIGTSIEEYAVKYNELMNESLYMKQEVFGYNNCINIRDALKKNNFFTASNKIVLKAKTKNEYKIIEREKEFDNFLKEEKNRVLNTKELKEKFEIINKKLNKNQELRDLTIFLENEKHKGIVCEYADIDKFKKKVWIKAFSLYESELIDLIEEYKKSSKEIKLLINQAKEEETDWKKTLKIFKGRFFVPFDIEPSNQEDVILMEDVPSFKYLYRGSEITKEKLLEILSTGEKRAYYILNFIFQVLAAEKEKKEKLIILDDISDSFDYNNKHAIIEYIYEISKYQKSTDNKQFNILLLTHNFDFYRNAIIGLSINDNSFIAYKNEESIEISSEQCYKNNIFINNMKQIIEPDIGSEKLNKSIISTIPIVRTLIEFQVPSHKKDSGYCTLTSLLHYNPERTKYITLSEIKDIFQNYWVKTDIKRTEEDKNIKVYNEIIKQADLIIEDKKKKNNKKKVLEIQDKLVLSMAIRLTAEIFMIDHLGENILEDIDKYQTRKLLEKYKEKYSDNDKLHVLERANMLTGEFIHLNSFMYEPLLDISDMELRKLYNETRNLSVEQVTINNPN